MRRSKITTIQIIDDFKTIHGNLYNYSEVSYKTMHHKVIIICNRHGKFNQTPNAHIRQRQGCPKCSIEYQISCQKDSTESFVSKAKIIHGEKYDYSKVIYGNTAHDKVEIICKEHGSFMMTPNSHLSAKSKCPQCMRRHTGWTKSSWKLSCEGKIAKLYIIRCFNENESFYKIGITNKNTIQDRFYCTSIMPYQYEIIHLIENKDNPIYIYDLERALHKLHTNFKYLPNIRFAGDSECFSKIINNYADIH